MARFAATGPFEGTKKRLLYATGAAAAMIAATAVLAGVLRGFNGGLDLVLGSLVVLAPSFWVALSLTARRSAGGAVWMGLARYTAAAVGFALLFALRPSSSPGMVLLGSILALLIPPIVLAWQQRPSK
ncbi:hypothetical protein N9O79_01960 [Luminiphilus sp.]|nr:hypothetical protein [Luminiphilus sp.]